jgi:hypothetical protein
MGLTRMQAERLARDVEIVASGLGTVSVAALARRTGRTPTGVRKFIARQRLAPTRDAGYITAQALAREFVALSPQSVTAKCRSGAIPARRNTTHTAPGSERRRGRRGHGWWLISLDLVPALQARYGARTTLARWQSGIPRWAHREAA